LRSDIRYIIRDAQVAIPCRPAKIFTVYVLDVPEELPEDDIRHALYKYRSIVEVTRLPLNTGTVCESRKCKCFFPIFLTPSLFPGKSSGSSIVSLL
jgi:hypothetical protein